MDIRLQDPEIARRVKAFAAALTAEKAKQKRIFRMSYAKRLRAFLSDYPIREAVGFLSWYEKPNYSYPLPLRYCDSDYEKYFHSGEGRPCIMRGSIYAMKWRRQIQWHMPDAVLERFLRRRKLTFLYIQDWDKWLNKSNMIKRLGDKWWGTAKWDHNFVRSYTDGHLIVLDGKKKWVTQAQFNSIEKMYDLSNKLSEQRADT